MVVGYSLSPGRQRRLDRQLRRRSCLEGHRHRSVEDGGGRLADDRVPRDVRRHHAGADHRRHRRPHEVLGLGGVRRRSGCCSCTSPVVQVGASAAGSAERGALDFAGGTAIHINAGIAALAAVLVLGKRKGWPHEGHAAALAAARDARHRHPVVRLVRLQRRLGARRQRPRRAGVHEHVPRRRRRHARLAAWSSGSRDGHPTNLGAASGIVAGLVAITPVRRLRVGRWRRSSSASIAGVVVLLRRQAQVQGRLRRRPRRRRRAPRRRARRLAAARAASPTPRSSGWRLQEGLFFGGGLQLLGEQVLATASAIVWSFVVTLVIVHGAQARRSASGSPTRTRRPASTSPSTPRPPTTDRAPT